MGIFPNLSTVVPLCRAGKFAKAKLQTAKLPARVQCREHSLGTLSGKLRRPPPHTLEQALLSSCRPVVPMQSLRAPTLALGVSEGAKRRAVAGSRLARPVSVRHHRRIAIRNNAVFADADQAQRWIDAWKARLNAPRVVGVGSAGVDYLASVAAFPKPDEKLRTDAFETQGGGNCGNALTAVARLGLRPSILTKLSDDGAGKAILDELRDDGVDTAHVVIEPGKSSPFTYIIVDREGSTRTCIHTPGPEFTPKEMPLAAIERLLDGASLCYFDGRLTEVAIEVAKVAKARGVPVLVEGERLRDNLPALLAMGDYVCTSANYPQDSNPDAQGFEAAMVAMASKLPAAKAIVTTLGSRGAVCLVRAPARAGESARAESLADVVSKLEKDAAVGMPGGMLGGAPVPAWPVVSDAVVLTDAGDEAAAALGAVEVIFAPAAKLQKSSVVDTTGAGDAFIGSMCYGVATGMELKDAMRLGAYVAAKKCGSLGARPGLPDISEVPEAVFQGKEKPKVAAAAVNKTASRPPAVRKAKAPREMTDLDKEFADGTRKSIAPGLSKWMLKLGRRYQ